LHHHSSPQQLSHKFEEALICGDQTKEVCEQSKDYENISAYILLHKQYSGKVEYARNNKIEVKNI
jgi:hypothetical protein